MLHLLAFTKGFAIIFQALKIIPTNHISSMFYPPLGVSNHPISQILTPFPFKRNYNSVKILCNQFLSVITALFSSKSS